MSKPGLAAPFRAAAFDLDGTLIDTAPDLVTAVNGVLTASGYPALPEARIRSFIGDGVEQLMWRALSASFGTGTVPPNTLAMALGQFRDLYLDELFHRSRIYPGVVDTLQALSSAGLSLCCVTNKEQGLALPLLEAAGLARFLDFTLCAGQPQERKPSPVMLLSACARLGIRPRELLWVGDSSTDIRAGRAAGCTVVAVSYGYDQNLAAGPAADAMIGNLSELLGQLDSPASH
jgi:phosphoglycolate phosphatase